MIAAKKKPEPTLAERIEEVHVAIAKFIDEKAAELKAGQCGDLPIGTLRALICRNQSCLCAAFASARDYGK